MEGQLFVPQEFKVELVDTETTQGWDMVLAGWSARKMLSTLGFLNRLTWKIAVKAGALVKVGDRQGEGSEYMVVPSALQALAEQAEQGLVSTRFALKGLTQYLSKWWVAAVVPITDLKSMRQIRQDLAGLSLFDCEKGAVGSRYVPSIWMIDLPLILQFYRHLERAYLRMTDGTLESLPDHKGSNIVRLFNSLFKGIEVYRKEGDDLNPVQTKKEVSRDGQVASPETFYAGGDRLSFDEFAATPTRWSAKGLATWLGETIEQAGDRLRQWAGNPSAVDSFLKDLPF